jgi:hypothetical protein
VSHKELATIQLSLPHKFDEDCVELVSREKTDSKSSMLSLLDGMHSNVDSILDLILNSI